MNGSIRKRGERSWELTIDLGRGPGARMEIEKEENVMARGSIEQRSSGTWSIRVELSPDPTTENAARSG